ncbi:TonB-dependent receptor [Paramixta manurensis]|uniref:TonB-dependent receptor n=1 Tax=Paramixta manurensis TaxID=2740817 RepID=A0A6M8UJL9_9GAMM|nr:TonB-dependent receptor [Erwiniaceae bacterium PD-1]
MIVASRKYLFSLLPLFAGGDAIASTESSAEEKSIVVTASRSAASLWDSSASVQVINAETIENSGANTIADLLRDIPGVEVSDDGLAGRKQIRIRGEASSRVLVLIDGQEVTYQRAGMGSGPGLLIDDSALERIEVVKGPWSVLYGSQAIGGVVNFITRKGGDAPLAGSVRAVYDSATNGWRESAAAWGSLGQFDYRINGSYADHGDRHTPDGRLSDTHFSNNAQGLWLGYTVNQHKFGLSLDRYKLATQTWSDAADLAEFSVRLPKLAREKVGLFYDYAAEGRYLRKVHLDAYQQVLERKFDNRVTVITPSGSPLIGDLTIANRTQTHDKQNTRGLTLQSDFALPGDNALIVGTQYQQDRVAQTANTNTASGSSTGFPGAVNYQRQGLSHNHWEQSSLALFGQNEWAINDNWRWTLGARQYWLESKSLGGNEHVTHSLQGESDAQYGNQTTHDKALVAATSLRYSGFNHTLLRMGFAQGYVYPTITHLFGITSAGGGVTYGNPDLEAEHSNNLEFGARYNGNQWFIDSALFYSTARNYIATLSCSGQAVCQGNRASSRSNYQYYANVDQAKTWGMELHAEYNGWPVSPYLSGTLLRRELTGDKVNTRHTGEPTLTGRLGVKHTRLFSHFDLSSDLFLRAASAATDDTGATRIRNPGWSTLNATLSSRFGAEDRYQLSLDLNNLTNQRYRTAHESLPAAGFNVAVGFGVTF